MFMDKSTEIGVPCETCGGMGHRAWPDGGGHEELCEDCNGSGQVSQPSTQEKE